MKKDVKKKVVRILLVLFIVGILVSALNMRTEPVGFVEERTVDQQSTLFYDYTIVRYPAKVEVLTPTTANETMVFGIDTGTDELDFSKVEVGSFVKKMVNLTTTDGKVSKISVVAKGSIKPLLKFGKNDFLLNGNDVIDVTMFSAEQEVGNYTGEVDVVIQRSNSDLLRRFLGY